MANILDYKKEYKDLYSPKTTPMIVDVGEMQFVAMEGKGNPNDVNGAYQKAIPVLYGVQYTLKMSKMGDRKPDGYFDYVVPPLEGFWWLDGNRELASKNASDDGWVSLGNKSDYCWISMIRLPEFVDEKVFQWACEEVFKKKKIDAGKALYLKIKEGLCVQCLHIGPYDDDPKTLMIMHDFIAENGLLNDVNETRRHHEIYLSDPRKTEISKLKTILRIPVKRNFGF